MPGGERKKQANGGWGALNKFQSPFLLAFEVESELLPFKFQSPPSSRSVTEGFEKKVIVLTAVLIRAHAPALVFQELSLPLLSYLVLHSCILPPLLLFLLSLSLTLYKCTLLLLPPHLLSILLSPPASHSLNRKPRFFPFFPLSGLSIVKNWYEYLQRKTPMHGL